MQKHIETTLGLKDVHKKIEHWATNHDFNETDSDIGKETLKVIVVKNYGTLVKFRWGLCIGLFFIGAILGAIATGTTGIHKEADPVAMLMAVLFPIGYIAYYFYKKNGGMKFQANINASILDGKTDIQIKSDSDSEELKNDIIKLYNSLAE